MIHAGIPALLSTLTQDLVLVCDHSCRVYEANTLAVRLLGDYIVGKPFIQLLPPASQSKGNAFLEHMYNLNENQVSDTWELLFDTPSSELLLLNVRGGATGDGSWLLVGSRESPQLTALYHEVLAMNSELTTLIRQISKEQARLIQQLERLTQTEEHYHG